MTIAFWEEPFALFRIVVNVQCNDGLRQDAEFTCQIFGHAIKTERSLVTAEL